LIRTRYLLLLPVILALPTCVAASTDISGTISSDAEWTPAGAPYHLVGNTTIVSGVTVTVRPGVEVIAQGNYQLTVQGKLRCFGLRHKPVVFKSTTPTTPGNWMGIYLTSGSVGQFFGTSFWGATNCVTVDGAWAQFDTCWFLYAGQDGLVALNDATLQVETATFAYNQRRGLYIITPDPIGNISDCVFMSNGEYPIHLKANCVGMLQDNLSFHNNGEDLIGVSCSASNDIRRSQTWKRQPLPFDMLVDSSDILEIPSGLRLTIAAGCELIADRIEVYGTLIAGQSEQAPTVIRGATETPGCWDGIFLHPGSVAQLTNTNVRLADTAFTMDDALLSFTDGLIRDCQYDGIIAYGSSQLHIANSSFHSNGRNHLRLSGLTLSGTIAGCTFTASGDYPVYAVARNCFMLGGGNQYVNNSRQAVGVACQRDPDLPSSQTWHAQGVPFDLTANIGGTALCVAWGATWTLQPGVAIAGGSVYIKGQLEAQGTALQPVVFTTASQPPVNGSWEGIAFYPAAGGVLQHCRIQHAATGVLMQSASPRLQDCLITECSHYGLFISGTAQPTIYHCQITDNDGTGVRITNQARPNLGNLYTTATDDDGQNNFINNGGPDISNASPRNIRAQNNWWGTADTGLIDARIVDGADNPGAGRIYYKPIISPQSNTAPVLEWSGLAGSHDDGVSPDSVDPYQYADFRVKYIDGDGQPPTYIQLHLLKSDAEFGQSPHEMALLPGQSLDYAAGVIYHFGTRLPAGSDYSYYFSASDGYESASGNPTTPHAGPTVGTSSAGALLASVFAQQAPAGNVAIHLQMLTAGRVDVEALNIAGRSVARIVTGRLCEPGHSIVLWDTRGATGTKLPAGCYLLHIRAAADSGLQQQAVTLITVRR